MQKITPCLWFDGQAEEAMKFYLSIFKNGKVLNASPGMDGKLLAATFEMNGSEFMVLNGGPQFKFTEAISLFVSCEDQTEVDMFWEKLSAGGSTSQCGWLKDKFGLSWQIVPKQLGEYLGGPDAAGAGRAMQAMLKMTKLDIAELKRAYEGK
jgi:predicted 3-demethylubiquinone-9 3-methyltransferase (glyoxalase superfamily)